MAAEQPQVEYRELDCDDTRANESIRPQYYQVTAKKYIDFMESFKRQTNVLFCQHGGRHEGCHNYQLWHMHFHSHHFELL